MNAGILKAVAVFAVTAMIVGCSMVSANITEKGLYSLDATYTEVSTTQTSTLPGILVSFESVYHAYYGDYIRTDYTVEDMRMDEEFWNEYCTWKPTIRDNGDGTYDVECTTRYKGTETVTMSRMDTTLTMGTMFSDIIYALICEKNGVEAFSDESLCNSAVGVDIVRLISGGIYYQYYLNKGLMYVPSYIQESDYLSLGEGVASVTKVDPETLTRVLEDAGSGEKSVLYLASGARITTKSYYNNNVDPCNVTGSGHLFFQLSSLNECYAWTEAIGMLLGFDQTVIHNLIEKWQLTLFTIHKSVERKSLGEKPLVYWEGTSGKATGTAMDKLMMEFLGFDTTLMDSAEHDLESLLQSKPSLLCFYKEDTRSMEEKMRVRD